MKPVALITGASRGIGNEIAQYFAKKGYTLILVARSADRLEELANQIDRSFNVKSIKVPIDIREHDSVRNTIMQVINQVGRLDVLVNSAGVFRYGTIALSMEDFNDLIETNVKAVHNIISMCIDALKSTKGHIFNIASVTGLEGFASIGGYTASKFALVGYGQSLGKELLGSGINVTTLCPDIVDTDMSKASGINPEKMIPRKDIARAIDFVLSLSPAAIVNQIIIKCRVIEEAMNIRK